MKNLALSVLFVSAVTGCNQQAPMKKSAPTKVAHETDTKRTTRAPIKEVKVDRGTSADSRDQVDADGIIRRGTTLTASLEKMTVAQTLAAAKKYDNKTVKIAGKVDQVCAKKGCWWMLTGDKPEQTIRITAKDYGFFVPRSVKGKDAVVEGLFEVKTLSDEEAEHLAKDSGDKNAKPIKQEVRLVATALEMRVPKALK